MWAECRWFNGLMKTARVITVFETAFFCVEARGRSYLIKISAILTAPGGLKAGLTSLFVVVILYFSAPSVAHFAMNPGMTGFTYSF